MKRITGAAALGAALLVGAGLSAPSVQAGYVVALTEQGGNVVASGSGAIDLTDLLPDGGGTAPVFLSPISGEINTGTVGEQVSGYLGVSGPSSFGRGNGAIANGSSGDFTGIFLNPLPGHSERLVVVPQDYVSDSPLSDSATYLNQTFASLGATPGVYEWTWGAGPNQNFTLIIGAAAVPEPASAALLGVALAGLLLVRARRRSLDVG